MRTIEKLAAAAAWLFVAYFFFRLGLNLGN